jgi:hypothetical protein
MRACWALLLWVLAGCGSAGSRASGQPEGIDWGPRPPPKPGSSISHTRMCECLACVPRACCQGADETQPTCSLEESVTATQDTLDFGAEEGCGIEVQSCTQRCTLEVWRVDSAEHCSRGRPQTCCTDAAESG